MSSHILSLNGLLFIIQSKGCIWIPMPKYIIYWSAVLPLTIFWTESIQWTLGREGLLFVVLALSVCSTFLSPGTLPYLTNQHNQKNKSWNFMKLNSRLWRILHPFQWQTKLELFETNLVKFLKHHLDRFNHHYKFMNISVMQTKR